MLSSISFPPGLPSTEEKCSSNRTHAYTSFLFPYVEDESESGAGFLGIRPFSLALESFHTHRLCRLRRRMQCYQMESFTRSPVFGPAEMPAQAPTFGNAVRDDLDMPEVGTAAFSVTMFLNEPFHTQVKSCR